MQGKAERVVRAAAYRLQVALPGWEPWDPGRISCAGVGDCHCSGLQGALTPLQPLPPCHVQVCWRQDWLSRPHHPLRH